MNTTKITMNTAEITEYGKYNCSYLKMLRWMLEKYLNTVNMNMNTVKITTYTVDITHECDKNNYEYGKYNFEYDKNNH